MRKSSFEGAANGERAFDLEAKTSETVAGFKINDEIVERLAPSCLLHRHRGQATERAGRYAQVQRLSGFHDRPMDWPLAAGITKSATTSTVS